MGRSQGLYKKAKLLIPGGTQLLSKRPEMFLPELWPAYYKKAKGCAVWDLDGNKYIDMSIMGVGCCVLGYADGDIDRRVKHAIDNGNMCTLNSPEEVALAKLLLSLHPWAEMVRYTRTGGEAMTVAVRIARAYSRKDTVLFCGYHGWHDWYLSANLSSDMALDGQLLPGLAPQGVCRQLKETAVPFMYNDTEGFLKLFSRYKNKTGAIIIESIRNHEPRREFIQAITKAAKKNGIPLIVDEITAGFRLIPGGAHLLFNFEPDIAVFAKGMSNGFPMAAIIGKKKVMQSAQDTFISSTYWTERVGPVAALATIEKFIKNDVSRHLCSAGSQVLSGWKDLAIKHNLAIETSGIEPLAHFSFKSKDSLILNTLFTQLMLAKGFLAGTAFYASYAHKENHIKSYLDAVDLAFNLIAKAIAAGNPKSYLKTRVCHSGFKRLT